MAKKMIVFMLISVLIFYHFMLRIRLEFTCNNSPIIPRKS